MQSSQGETQRAVLFWGFPPRQEEEAEEGHTARPPASFSTPSQVVWSPLRQPGLG